jgi:xylulokinase
LSKEAAVQTGLKSGLPILAYGGDAVLGAEVVMGKGTANQAIGLISSGGQLLVTRDTPCPCPEQGVHLLPQMEQGKWLSMAAFLAAGLSLEWWRESLETIRGNPLCGERLGASPHPLGMEHLLAGANRVPLGSEGLVFLPHIAGERTPLLDPDASGAFLGIRNHHTLDHFTRAILEGVAFSFRWGLEILEQSGGVTQSFTLGGGGTKSTLWCQIFSEVIQREVQILSAVSETSLLGAALAGAKALGWETSGWYPEKVETRSPDPRNWDSLEKNYQVFRTFALSRKQLFPSPLHILQRGSESNHQIRNEGIGEKGVP